MTPVARRQVAVEILHTLDCPHRQEARVRLSAAAEAEGIAISVSETLIETVEAARQRRFPGSPTVRVEGRDVEPGAEARELFGLG